jgi:hypothetical protein
MGTGFFPGVESGRGVTLTLHLLLVPRYKKQSKAIPLLFLRDFVVCKKGETYQLVICLMCCYCLVADTVKFVINVVQ